MCTKFLQLSFFIVLLMCLSCKGEKQPNMDPLNITSANLESMVGNPTPFEKWAEWGRPETLDGTNNQYWVIYLPTANVSMVADKSTQTVLFADFGKTSAMDHVKKLK